MPYCKACGYELGNPLEDLHDPDGLSDVAKEVGEGGIEAEDPHLIVRDGEKGWRYYCDETGQVTSIIEQPPDKEGEGPSPKEEKEENSASPQRRIYDVKEEKSPMEVLADVVTRPFLGLNEDQIGEVKDWAEDYDGQIPPDMLEDILGNMSGVQKQTAQLARQKYEVKLNKWVQEQSQGSSGPPIGITSRPPQSRSRSDSRSAQAQQTRQPQQGQEQEPSHQDNGDQNSVGADSIGGMREYSRKRRIKRRNDALDTATETIARETADEIAREVAQNFGLGIKLVRKVLHSKAEKDPDWFLEKAEEWDVDILEEFMTASEVKKQEGKRAPQSEKRIDDALKDLKGEGGQQPTGSEKVNNAGGEADVGGAFDDLNGEMPEEDAEEQEPDRGPFDDLKQTQGEQ